MTVPPTDKRYTFDRVVRLIISALTLWAVIWLLRYLSDVLLPFAAAVVLAYLLNPVVTLFAERTKRRGLAVGITIGGLALVGVALGFVMFLVVASQAEQFGQQLSRLREDVVGAITMPAPPVEPAPAAPPVEGETATLPAPAAKSATGVPELREAWEMFRSGHGTRTERLAAFRERIDGTAAGVVVQQLTEYVQSEDFKFSVASVVKRVAAGGWTVGAFFIHVILFLAGLIIVVIYLVFLLLDYPAYARTWRTFLPPAYRATIVEFLTEFDVAMRRYFRGQFVVAMITGLLLVAGFTIIGLPMAVPLGLAMGVLNMVPYLQAVGLVPAFFLALMKSLESDGTSLGWGLALVLVVYAVVQIIQDTVITPRIMGRATGLRPVAILLGVFVWGKLLGFLGLLLAIPLTCLGIAYYRRFVLNQSREQSMAAQ